MPFFKLLIEQQGLIIFFHEVFAIGRFQFGKHGLGAEGMPIEDLGKVLFCLVIPTSVEIIKTFGDEIFRR